MPLTCTLADAASARESVQPTPALHASDVIDQDAPRVSAEPRRPGKPRSFMLICRASMLCLRDAVAEYQVVPRLGRLSRTSVRRLQHVLTESQIGPKFRRFGRTSVLRLLLAVDQVRAHVERAGYTSQARQLARTLCVQAYAACHAYPRALMCVCASSTLLGIATLHTYVHAVRAPSLERALVLTLQQQGLTVDPRQLAWLRASPDGFGVRPVLLAARRGHELHDIYYADVRASGTAVLGVHTLTNITRTSSADEDLLVGAPSFAAYAARVGDAYEALVLADFRGESPELTRDWPWYAKLQNAITNYQDTGRAEAFGLCRYRFVAPASALTFAVEHGELRANLDGRELWLSPQSATPLKGAELAKLDEPNKGQPGVITWVVDTVRRIPGVGRAPIEWLEHVVFRANDRLARAYHGFVKTDTAEEVKRALSVTQLAAAAPAVASIHEVGVQLGDNVADDAVSELDDAGWPPPALTPLLPERVEGEGTWLPVSHDAFVAENPNAPALFHQTFIRVDPARSYTRVYITLWDPRQVQLGVVMGTKEPESATGETGSGVIPRDPYVLSHLVGAFNGGFQAMHGEFGMMAGKRVYLPPKPYAATVAVFEDGATAMGSWPGPGEHAWDESFANSQIPKDMLAMRQNLTSVVEGEHYNPWERWWWGAAPEWEKEQTYIHRSGLCITREGFMGYFWGEAMGPEALGQAMLAARCARGMHLDMNGKHTGFEFYRPYAAEQGLPDLGRALHPSEFEGVIPTLSLEGSSALRVRARLAVATMTPLRFPRYLAADGRDYFYLTRKPVLPGAPVQTEDGRTLHFSTQHLPHAGFPRAFASARDPELGVLVRVDLARAVPAAVADPSLSRRLGILAHAYERTLDGEADTLCVQHRHGRLRAYIGPVAERAWVVASGRPMNPVAPDVASQHARVGLGVDDEGFLIYAQADRDGALAQLLRQAGVSRAITLQNGQLALQTEAGLRTLEGTNVADTDMDAASSLSFLAETRPAARVLFEEVQPVPYRIWGAPQGQRVRYFPNHPPRFQAPISAR